MPVHKITGLSAVWIVMLFFYTYAPAQPSPDQKTQDVFFLQQAYQDAAWLLKLGKLAEQIAASHSVRDHGRQIASFYERHREDIKHLAAQKGFLLPEETHPARLATLQNFSRRTGAELDRHYISLMIDENRLQLALYQKEAKEGRDADIVRFAVGHLKRIEGDAAVAMMILNHLPKPVLK